MRKAGSVHRVVARLLCSRLLLSVSILFVLALARTNRVGGDEGFAPPTDLEVLQSGRYVELTWNPPAVGQISGYNVYRAEVSNGPWIRLNDGLVSETTYIDRSPLSETSYYAVSAVTTQAVETGLTVAVGITTVGSLGEAAASTSPSSTFQWPLSPFDTTPRITQDYACRGNASSPLGCTRDAEYHTGIDMTSTFGDPAVYASKAGTVVSRFSSCGPGSIGDTCNGGWGNTVIIQHDDTALYSLYAHLLQNSILVNVGNTVTIGQPIATMGSSGYSSATHLHFGIKSSSELGPGYTSTPPDVNGFFDPWKYISSTTIANPVAVKVVNVAGLNVRRGPSTDYQNFTTLSFGQEFVAFAKSGNWYRIYLPCNNNSSCAGWIAGMDSGTTFSVEDSLATQVEVKNTGTGGLFVRPSPGSSSSLDKIWDGQRFVTFGTPQSGANCSSPWYQIYLPAISQATSGWSCGDYLTVVPGSGPGIAPGDGAPNVTIQQAFINAYNADGGTATLGQAQNTVQSLTRNFYSPASTAYSQNFSGGSYGPAVIEMLAGTSTAFTVRAGFYNTYQSAESTTGQMVSSLLVAPSNNEAHTSSLSVEGTDYNWQPFLKGGLYFYISSPIDGGAFSGQNWITYVWGDLADRYSREGGRTGAMGLPLFNVMEYPYNPYGGLNWWYQWFEKGFIWYAKNPSTGETLSYAYTKTTDVYSSGTWVHLGWCRHADGGITACYAP